MEGNVFPCTLPQATLACALRNLLFPGQQCLRLTGSGLHEAGGCVGSVPFSCVDIHMAEARDKFSKPDS